jgi:hypothetical protein
MCATNRSDDRGKRGKKRWEMTIELSQVESNGIHLNVSELYQWIETTNSIVEKHYCRWTEKTMESS